MIKAVLFDLDGVLIETEPQTFQFYQQELKKQNIDLPDSAFVFKAGRKSVDFWNDALTEEQKAVVDTKSLVEEKRARFNTDPEQYVGKFEGVEKVLRDLKEAGFVLAVTSQNESQMINTVVDWLTIRSYFDVILSIDAIQNLKPNPEIYELAAKKLGVTAEECIVIEDSKDGVTAAKNANMLCVGMKHTYTPSGSIDHADFIINNISEFTPEFIKEKSK